MGSVLYGETACYLSIRSSKRFVLVISDYN
jgi:hypothetical protein